MPSISVYRKALTNKRVAAYMLLPLIEFEFAFNGAQKPALAQSESNNIQLRAIYRICRNHGWLASSRITKLGNRRDSWFKISNTGFREIYELAGPLSDSNKDKWAKLLCERSDAGSDKSRQIRPFIIKALRRDGELTTNDICLRVKRLPYTVTRHLRKLENKGMVRKTETGWKLLLAPQHTRPHEAGIHSKRTS